MSCCKSTGSVLFYAFFSNAVDESMPIRLIMASLFFSTFFFSSLHTNLFHIIFITFSFLIGVVVVFLYWCFLRLARAKLSSNICEEDILTYEVGVNNNDDDERAHHKQRKRNMFYLNNDTHSSRSLTCCCCYSNSQFVLQYKFIFPTVELLLLGIFVLLSPHIMRIKSLSKNFVSFTNESTTIKLETYWIDAVWRVWYLHIFFLFSFAIPFLAIFVVALIHFIILLAHYNVLNYQAIFLSLLWFLAPLIWIIISILSGVIRECFGLNWKKNSWFMRRKNKVKEECDNQSFKCEGPWWLVSSLLLSHQGVNMRLRDEILNNKWRKYTFSTFHFGNKFVTTLISMLLRRLKTDYDMSNRRMFDQSFSLRKLNQTMESFFLEDFQAQFLFLRLTDNVILGASAGFAALVGMSVEELTGYKFIELLEKLEVENIEMVMEVIKSVLCFFSFSSGRVGNGCDYSSNTDNCHDGNVKTFGRRTFTKIDRRRSMSRETSQAEDVTVDADSFGYSFAEKNMSFIQRISENGMRRILLRGRYPHCLQSSSSSSSSPLPLEGNEVSLMTSTDNKKSDSSAQSNISGEFRSFAITLDVWVERFFGTDDVVVVLCQPYLHHVLQRVSLPCFLVHPLTGRVLFWSQTAELQTSKSAYDMVGWQVHAAHFPCIPSSLSGSQCGVKNGDNCAEGEARMEKIRKQPLDSPLWATVYLPFSLSASLLVTLHPLSGSFVEEEREAFRKEVSGLIWPPRHFSKTTSWESYKSSKTKNKTFERNNDKEEFVHTTQDMIEDFAENTGATVNGSGDTGKKKNNNQWWNFSLLANSDGNASWLTSSAAAPLLFLIHGERKTISSPNVVVNNKECDTHSFIQNFDGILRELQLFLNELSSEKKNMTLFNSSLQLEELFHSASMQLRQLKIIKEQFNKEKLLVDDLHDLTAAPEDGVGEEKVDNYLGVVTEKDDNDNNNNNNNNSNSISNNISNNINYDDNVDDNENAISKDSVVAKEQLEGLIISATSNNLGPAETTVSLHISTHKNDNKPLSFSDSLRNKMDGDEDNIAVVHFEDNNLANDDLSLRHRDNGDNKSEVFTLQPSDSSKKSKFKNMLAQRLISPTLHSNGEYKETNNDVAKFNRETSLHRRIASYDARVNYNQQKHLQCRCDFENLNYFNKPVSSLQTQAEVFSSHSVGTLFAAPSVRGVIASTLGVSSSHEKQHTWAMLRSSDDSTISSCFISVPFGKEFSFGRSSKCHAMASDTLVSSVQFTIVRYEGLQFQYSQLFGQHYPQAPVVGSEQLCTSASYSLQQLPLAAGNCVVKLNDSSANGTYVNVKKVGKGNSCLLRDGDFITFRLGASSFFSGFQFLLTDERGVPLRDVVNYTEGQSNNMECATHDNSNGNNNTNTNTNNNNNNNNIHNTVNNSVCGTGGSLRGGMGMRSRISGTSGGRHHHYHNNTIEWKIGEEMLGRGGSAEVYLGINLINGKLIAVKRVPLPHVGFDDDTCSDVVLKQYRSLQEEINVLSKAVHPNIVQYYGSSQNQKYFNILLEFVSGGSLRHLLDNFGKLGPVVICSYLRQTLEGLRYLHNNNIVHSDLKAANILVTDKGRVKISDFGTAKALNKQNSRSLNFVSLTKHSQENKIVTRRVAGTLLWMAPELVNSTGNVGPTRASDIWSVGCVLIEMLSSNAPWSEYEFESEEQIINLLRYTKEGPKVPECVELPELSVIARRCLTLTPGERPTCEELLQMVERAEERLRVTQTLSSSPSDIFINPQSTALGPALALAAEAEVVVEAPQPGGCIDGVEG